MVKQPGGAGGNTPPRTPGKAQLLCVRGIPLDPKRRGRQCDLGMAAVLEGHDFASRCSQNYRSRQTLSGFG